MKYECLTKEEADKNFKKYGANEILDLHKVSVAKILFRQIAKNFVIYLLIFATILSFWVKNNLTGYIIIGVIVIVIATGFFQEYRAEQSMKALKSMMVSSSIVVRDGVEQKILSREIVPGDILILKNGDKIPADCVVVEQNNIRVNESILTGESAEISKRVPKDLKHYKNENMIFAGTYVVGGKCTALVVKTGMNTKFGKIADIVSSTEKELPLQKKVNKIAKYLAITGMTFAILSGIMIIFRSAEINEEVIGGAIIVAISIAVASFPEGFPVVLTTSLAYGANRMSKKNAIINRLSILETLGETTVICTDKTGTLTKGEMTVKKIFCDGTTFDVGGVGLEKNGEFFNRDNKINVEKENELKSLLRASVFCNDSLISENEDSDSYSVSGSPTETALLVAGAKAKIFKENFNYEKVFEIPFDSDKKTMSVVIRENKSLTMYSKGALEILLEKSKYIQKNGGVFRLTAREKNRILAINSDMASDSYRTIGLAYKKVERVSSNISEDNLVFLGIVAMDDPPRLEIKDALEACKTAGIKVKMITGDNKETAISVAKQIGMEHINIMSGEEMDEIREEDFIKKVNYVSIFYRVLPEQKLKIVRALKLNGEIVTMTGDGVNDAPALKEANIGVAMGINGTDVSRSVSDLTLKDDNFATIVDAIREGRNIFNNIQKFSAFQVSTNFAEMSIVLFAVLIGLPIPLIAIQILFINLFSDESLSITLAFNPQSKDVMTSPPRRKSNIISKNTLVIIFVFGLLMSISSVGVFWYALHAGFSEVGARTLAFSTMIFFEITNALSYRSFRKMTYNRSLLTNKLLFYVSCILVVALFVMIYSPINKFLGLTAINPIYLIIPAVVSLLPIVVSDLFKYINSKKQIFKEYL